MSEYKEQIAEEWKSYWKSHKNIPKWDLMSQVVFDSLVRHIPFISHLRICEIGCGTGRISLQLALKGAAISAIDIVPDAVAMTRRTFLDNTQRIDIQEGSIFSIPFRKEKFDVTWNAGVIEHFSAAERQTALREMARVTRPGGLVVTLNPSSASMLYRVGKFLAELTGRWPYGHEDPITTLRASAPASLHFEQEYTTGFFVILPEAFRVFPFTEPVAFKFRDLLLRLYSGRLGGTVRALDRLLCTLLGGYLLVSVFRKKAE
jgi:2-polyprenyl-3-methyl-5-hydroxy-6-metoxy-1,4-benzoquinol methylase